MSEMIDRIAKVVAPDCFPVQDDPELCWCPQCCAEREADQNQAREVARGVIEAMRVPTKDMVAAGDSGMTSELLIEGDSLGPWINMINAALK